MTNKRCYVNAKDMCLKHTHFFLQIFNITTEYNAYQLNWAKSENNETFQMKIYKTCIVASVNKVGFMDNLNISQTRPLSYYKGLLYNPITLWTIRPLELSLVQYKWKMFVHYWLEISRSSKNIPNFTKMMVRNKTVQ